MKLNEAGWGGTSTNLWAVEGKKGPFRVSFFEFEARMMAEEYPDVIYFVWNEELSGV